MVDDKNSKRKIIVGLLVLFIFIGGAGAWTYSHRYISPVPKSAQESVSFPVYYPDQNKLPLGYTFNLGSFSNPRKDVLLYAVDYSVGKKIVISLQKKPSVDQINKFYLAFIPLTNQVNLPLGQARIGITSNQPDQKTIVSLPTNDGVWIIATAPVGVDQKQLNQVMSSLRE